MPRHLKQLTIKMVTMSNYFYFQTYIVSCDLFAAPNGTGTDQYQHGSIPAPTCLVRQQSRLSFGVSLCRLTPNAEHRHQPLEGLYGPVPTGPSILSTVWTGNQESEPVWVSWCRCRPAPTPLRDSKKRCTLKTKSF